MPTSKSIRVTVNVWGAGPAMGGSSYIEFLLSAGGWQVFGGGSATDGREQLGSIAADAGWRERVAFIVQEAPPGHEEHPTSSVRVTGARGLEAALLKMAWSGPDASGAVETLLGLDDAELEGVILRSGADLDQCLNSVQQLIDQLGDDRACSLIRKSLATNEFTWEAVVKHAGQLLDAEEGQEAAAAEKVSLTLQPHKEAIERLLTNWWRIEGGASSSATQMMMSAKRGAIKRYCENYVLASGGIPVGTHTVAFAAFGRDMSINVDFDQLHTEQP